MTFEKHIEEFMTALNGGRGDLDAWLECNNEAECRAAIIGAIAVEREECAKVCDSKPIMMDDKPSRRGPNGAGTWYEDSPVGYVVRAISKAIRERSNAAVTGGESEA